MRLLYVIICFFVLSVNCSVNSRFENHSEITYLDLSTQKGRQTVVEKIPGQYLGQPNTVLLSDDKTIIVGYPEGHGHPNTILKKSTDGGYTWSDRLTTPENFIGDHYAPTLHLFRDAEGKERIIIFVVTPYIMTSISEDQGKTWTPFKPVYPGQKYRGYAPPMSVIQIRNQFGLPEPGHYMALYHDRFNNQPKILSIVKIETKNGGLTWSKPVYIGHHPDFPGAQPCEPCVIRSPDRKQLLCLMRENSRKYNSLYMTSDDEGETWSDMEELPLGLTGDRHNARYAPDGRLVVTIRDIKGKWNLESRDTEIAFFSKRKNEYDGRYHRDFVAWVGTFNDIIHHKLGQYIVRLLDHKQPNADCGYSGLELLPDGTFVSPLMLL